MRVAILSARTGWQTDQLCRALSERGHVGQVVPYEGLLARLGMPSTSRGLSSDGLSLFDMDAVLARIVPDGSLEQIIYRVDALHWLEDRGVTVMNSPRAIERCVDKFYTTALLERAGLPTPQTVVCERTADAMAAIREMGDVLIKPIFGSMGHGIVRVSDPDVGFRVARTLEQTRTVFYVQRVLEHGGRDFRLFVVGGRVVASIERRSPDGQWRTNVSQDGVARPCRVPVEWADLALAATSAVGADYAGVDVILADGEPFLVEVNAIPGWRGVQEATGCDVAASIVTNLEAKVASQDTAARRPA